MQIARKRSLALGLKPEAPLQDLSLSQLRYWHQVGLQYYRQRSASTGPISWLAIKQALAQRLLAQCNFCVHHCQVDRSSGQLGYCRLGPASPLAGSYLHHGEEAPIRPTWALFFSGCTMHCSYCHNWRETFRFDPAAHFPLQSVLADLNQHRGQYKTLSLIGGTPEPHLHTLLELVAHLPEAIDVPLVLNHNATLSAEGLTLMEGVVDIYLPDFKHGNDACAWRLTKIQDYVQSVMANLQAARRQGAAMLVRHLVIPGHLDCCTRPVLERLAQDFAGVMVNVMFQYRPMYRAEQMPTINRMLSQAEQSQVNKWIQDLNLRQISE